MSRSVAPLAVEGVLRVDGPGGPFRVSGKGGRIDVAVPGLRGAWRAGGPDALRRVASRLASVGLTLHLTVRGHAVVRAGAGTGGGVRLQWRGLLGALLSKLRKGGRA